jgi:NADH:ubiquinone reductase (H+-translocating)
MAVPSSRILIVGGGYVGTYTALKLRRWARRGRVDVTLVAPDSFMTYQPFLPEAASGNIEPRHVVVPLRRALRGVRVLTGEITAADPTSRTASFRPAEGEPYDIGFDILVVGCGSVSRVLPVPGLAEQGVGFKSLPEAIYLRNRVLSRMDAGEATEDEAVRRRALTFLFVGGGYAGVEALAELEDLARDACRLYGRVRREDMRWVLVEATDSILPEIDPGLAAYALERLRTRGIEVSLGTRLESAEGGRMRLSDGTTFEADTLVWTTGVRAHALTGRLGLPVDDRGRLPVDAELRVRGAPGVWAAGDCAAVPDLVAGGLAPPTAQHALREARRLGRNIRRMIRGRDPKPFRYRSRGGLVSLGRYRGVATVFGLRLRGFLAWFLHRSYHVLMLPTINRKVRVMADWTLALFFHRDIVQLGSLQDPRGAFAQAAEDTRRDRTDGP